MYLKRILPILLAFFIAVTCITSGAEEKNNTNEMPTEEINVTAERVEIPTAKTGSSVTVINRKEIERQKKPFVSDYLQQVPGVNVSRVGPPGQQTTVFIRGAKNEHTLVLIDGVPANDVASPGGEFDFAALPADLIERIEVVRGPQSTIYGSKSMGGVINIITRGGRPSAEPEFKVHGGLEFGGYRSNRYNLMMIGSAPNVGYSAGVSSTSGGALSAAGPKYFANPDFDPYNSFNIHGKVNINTGERGKLNLVYNRFHNRANLDDLSGLGLDSDLYRITNTRNIFDGSYSYQLIRNKWESKLGVSIADTDRNLYENPFSPPGFVDRYNGQTREIYWRNYITAGNHTIQAGFNHQRETALFTDFDPILFESVLSPRQSATLTSFYLQDNFDIGERVFISAGLRNDNHSISGGRTTFRVSANAHLTDQLFLKSSYGTGFKAPTLFQLYSSYGNPNLRPETSLGWDAGLEYRSIDRKHSIGATYFNNRFTDLIDAIEVAPFVWQYYNVNRARTWGWELYGRTRVHDRLNFFANYTALRAVDDLTGLELIRRPRNKFTLGAAYDVIPEKMILQADTVSVGRREDMDFMSWPAARVTLPAYTLVNASVSYKLNRNLEAYIRAENLFNNRYEAVWGYQYPGRTFFGGMKFNF